MFNFVQVQGRRKFKPDAEIGQKGTLCKGLFRFTGQKNRGNEAPIFL